jgi:membrane-associated protease RseP (regulator of RpoE activity)
VTEVRRPEERTAAQQGVPPRQEDPPQPSGASPRGEGSSAARLAMVVAGTVAVGVLGSFTTLAVIGALVFMIFMHELGHYLTAKWSGMKVTEFFIGFGPRLWSFHRGDTEYGLKLIPAGAYVRIIGMSNLEEVAPEDEARTYRQKSYPRRLSVAVAGSAMHFLMAIALMFGLLVFSGEPADLDSDRWDIGVVTDGTPAADAGIRPGDRIVAVDGVTFASFPELTEHLRARPGEPVELEVLRDGQREVVDVTLARRNPATGEQVGFLGVGPRYDLVTVGPVEGAVEAVQRTGSTIWQSITSLGSFFSPSGIGDYIDTIAGSADGRDEPADAAAETSEEENRLLSPVGAVRVASQAADVGIASVVFLLFIINVFVGVFNLVPLLPLDGGHVVIATYERLRSRGGRRHFADVSKLMPLTVGVIAVLVLVGMSALYLDVSNPAPNPFQ